jgi:hypothetical protein
MKRSLAPTAAIGLLAAAMCLVSPLSAHAQRSGGRTGGGSNGTNSGPYYVVQIFNPPVDVGRGAGTGAQSQPDPYDVLDAQQQKDKQKELDKKYKDNYEKWLDEKKIDPKAPRPMKPSIKRLKMFKTKEVADEYKQKLEDELAKKEGDKQQPQR